MSAPTLVTVDDVRAAADRLRGSIMRTPLIPAPWADPQRPLWIKPESLQVIGAFKVRGALNAIGRIDPDVRTRGVVAYSSGNHAQAVAYAAARFGIDVIAGQGTIGLEIAEDLPDVGTVLIPVSGGGLASGIGTAIRALCPDARIYGVEPELAADTAAGLRRGSRVSMSIEDRNRTIADGLRSQPSELTFAHLQHVLTDVLTVSEGQIRSAVAELAIRARLVSEPSGAVALAAYRHHRLPPGKTVIILSGGNIEADLLAQIVAQSPEVGVHQGN